MSESATDRMRRERRKPEAAKSGREQAEAEHQTRAMDARDVEEICTEMSAVLRLLVKHNYPMLKEECEVRVPEKWLGLIGRRSVPKAAWIIGSRAAPASESSRGYAASTDSDRIYLLADGRLYDGDVACSPREMLARYSGGHGSRVYFTLHELRDKLEKLNT